MSDELLCAHCGSPMEIETFVAKVKAMRAAQKIHGEWGDPSSAYPEQKRLEAAVDARLMVIFTAFVSMSKSIHRES